MWLIIPIILLDTKLRLRVRNFTRGKVFYKLPSYSRMSGRVVTFVYVTSRPTSYATTTLENKLCKFFGLFFLVSSPSSLSTFSFPHKWAMEGRIESGKTLTFRFTWREECELTLFCHSFSSFSFSQWDLNFSQWSSCLSLKKFSLLSRTIQSIGSFRRITRILCAKSDASRDWANMNRIIHSDWKIIESNTAISPTFHIADLSDSFFHELINLNKIS